ncbi:MAG: hypothetical protein Q4P13_03490 [Psychrobacter sp.]|nr:hypothetical protein [Psychrobacter sp.]
MKISEITSFLNPFGDALATTFVLTLIILTVVTIVWLLVSAKESNWNKNWYGGDLEDSTNNLAGEHGSVNELSETVATKAEKVADIMPSMLLIVGLLGTFLGLGIALNKASNVLAMADTAGMDAAMTQLMGLMDGLGAKFKTSTWGILCFILLNLLFNVFGFKEKRLTWAIKKVREESTAKSELLAKNELDRHDTLISTLKSIDDNAKVSSQAIIQSIASQTNEIAKSSTLISQIRNDLNSNNRKLIESFDVAHEQALLKNAELFSNLKFSFDENNAIATKNSKDSIEQLKKIASSNEETQKSMQEFVEQTVGSMKSISNSADKMAEAAEAVGSSAEGLNNVVENLRNELEDVMSIIRRDLSETIATMGESFEQNVSAMSKNMGEATLGISKAVDELSTSVGTTMTDVTNVIGESMDLQRNSANEFTVTSQTLNEKIVVMTDLVTQLSGDITSGLKAVSASGRRIEGLNSRYEKYTDLIESITQTNQQLFESMQRIAADIPAMAEAVPHLSSNLQNTLEASVALQKESGDIINKLSTEIRTVVDVLPELSKTLENTLTKSINAQEHSNKIVERLASDLKENLTVASQSSPNTVNETAIT